MLFPQPLSPTKATVCPLSTVRFKPFKILKKQSKRKSHHGYATQTRTSLQMLRTISYLSLSPRERHVVTFMDCTHPLSRSSSNTYSSRVRLKLKGTMRKEHIAVLGHFCAEVITIFSQLQYTSTLAIHIVLNILNTFTSGLEG